MATNQHSEMVSKPSCTDFFQAFETLLPRIKTEARHTAFRYFPKEDPGSKSDELINEVLLQLWARVQRGTFSPENSAAMLGLIKLKLRDVAVDALRRKEPVISIENFSHD